MINIQIYSDYVCPFCYLGEQIVEKARQKHPELNFGIQWMPFELRPFPHPTLKPEDEYLPRVWQSSVYPMAEALGVSIKLPTVSPQPYTHLAFEGFQFAQDNGRGEIYTNRMFEAFFLEDQDIGKVPVLTELAGETGLDTEDFRNALESRKYKEKHQQALQHAYALGIQAVPCYQIGGHYYQGVLSEERLETILQEEAEKNS